MPFLAPLLDLSLPEARYAPLSLSPQQRRQRTLASLTELFMALSAPQPMLFALEDLHWVDPSTLEWLGGLLDQVPTSRLLLLMTCRPEFHSPWPSRSYLTQLTLNRLTPPQSARMASYVAGDTPLSALLLQQIVDHSDGVPLFIKEFTRSVLDSGSITTIPTTLQDVLMARLDQVSEARRTAQLGSVMGRQFSYTLLHAVSHLEGVALQQDLRRLVDRELLYQRGVGDEAVYLFKHALIQDAAYASLLRRTRQQLHQQVAQVLETQFPESKETQPEVLAHHYTEAGPYAQALPYWQQAGNSAIAKSAFVEGIAYLSRALALLKALPDTLMHRHTELDIQIAFAAAFHRTKGRAAPEVLQASIRARELSERIGDTPKRIRVLAQLRRFYTTSGKLRTALELAEEIAGLAQQTQDPLHQLESDYSLGTTLMFMGVLRDAQAHLARGAALGDRLRSDAADLISREVSRGGWTGDMVACRGNDASVLWLLGYADQARERANETLRLAQEWHHLSILAATLSRVANVYVRYRDASAVARLAASQMALCRELGLAIENEGMALQGWALVRQGEQERGLTQIQQVLDIEGKNHQLWHLALFADVCVTTGQIEEGMHRLAQAHELVEQTESRLYEAEFYRLQGELLMAESSDNNREAETCFRQALEVSRQQQAKSWELRAATSLARLWQQQDKRQAAYNLLSPVYAWFTEGFDTADLQDAKALLDALS